MGERDRRCFFRSFLGCAPGTSLTRVRSPSSQFVGGLDARQIFALVVLGGTSASATHVDARSRASFIEEGGDIDLAVFCGRGRSVYLGVLRVDVG